LDSRFDTVLALCAFAILAGFLLAGCGLLVCRFVLPRRLAPLKLPISPVVGAAFISLLAQWLSTGLAVGETAWLYVVLAGIGWMTTTARRFRWRTLPLLLVGVLALAAATAPAVRLGYLTAVSGNIDALSYVTRAEYLEDHSASPPDAQEGPLAIVASHARLRMVDTLLLALFGHLLDRRAFELLNPLGGLFLACSALGTWAWARIGLGFRQNGALLAAALVSVSSLLLWVVFDSYQSQGFGLALAPLALAVLAHAVRRPSPRSAALFGLLAAALISAYIAYGMWLIATTAAVWGVRLLGRRRLLRPAIGWAASALAVTLVTGWPGLVKSAGELKEMSAMLGAAGAAWATSGNIHVFPPIGEILGLYPHAAAAVGTEPPLGPSATLVLTAAGLALVLFGGWSLPRRRWLALVPLLVAVVMAVQQRFLVAPPHGFPYGYFKLAALIALCVVPLAVAGMVRLGRVRQTRFVGLAAMLLLVGLNLFHCAWTLQVATRYRVVPRRELLELATIRDVEPGGWVSVDVEPGLPQNWIVYLLRDYRLHFPGGVLMYQTNRTPPWPPRLALVQPSRAATLDTSDSAYRVLWHNSEYELRELTDPAAVPVASLAGSPQPVQAGESFVLRAQEKVFSIASPALTGQLKMPSDARRIRATLLVVADDKLVLPNDGARPLARGVWTLEADLSCLRSGLPLRLAGGRPFGISQLVALRASPEQRPGCFRVAPSPEGLAAVSWRPTKRDRLRFDVSLQRPALAAERNYRFDVWIRPVGGGDPWAVWCLGMPGKASLASLEVDLKKRSYVAKLEEKDSVADVTLGREQAGAFDSQLAWWDLQTGALAAVFKGPSFVRDDEGHVRSFEPAVATRVGAVQTKAP